MSLFAMGSCAFVNRTIIFNNDSTIASVCAASEMPEEQCSSMLSDHAVGLWTWEMTIPEDNNNNNNNNNKQVCFSYTQYIDGLGYVTPEFDRMFNSAKACQGVAVFIGAFAWFTLVMGLCSPFVRDGGVQRLSIYFLVALLFQSLAFLIFKSDICEPGFFSAYFGGTLPEGIASVSCSRSTATNMAMASVVLYFVIMVLAPAALAPLHGWTLMPAEPAADVPAAGSSEVDAA